MPGCWVLMIFLSRMLANVRGFHTEAPTGRRDNEFITILYCSAVNSGWSRSRTEQECACPDFISNTSKDVRDDNLLLGIRRRRSFDIRSKYV